MTNKPKKMAGTMAIAFILICQGFGTALSDDSVSEGKVATVNGSVVTQKEFDREIRIAEQQILLKGNKVTDAQRRGLRKKVLEGLINRELLYQESQREGIKVTKAQINKQLDSVKARFSSEDKFKKTLNGMGLSESDLESQLKQQIAIQELLDRKVVKNTRVRPEETKAYYDAHPDFFTQPEQVRARHILIKVDPKASESEKAASRKKIEGIRKRLEKGEDFATVAKEVSEGPSSAKGGDLGYFKRGQMVKPFEEVAFGLKPGEISQVVETRFGYHLIKVLDKKPKGTMSYAQVQEKLQRYLKQQKIRDRVSAYLEGLKGKAKVERFLTGSPR